MSDRAIVIAYEIEDPIATNAREIATIQAARAAGYIVSGVDRIPSEPPRAISPSQAAAILRGRQADAIAFHNGQAVRIVRTV